MQGKDWLYYIVDAMGRSYRKENGLVVAKNDRRPLRFTPDGWQDISIAWERDLSLFGDVRNFTLPLGLVIDGADIVRKLWYEGNYDQQKFLIIQKLKLFIDANNFYFYYDLFYKGELDFGSCKNSENKIEVSIAEGGVQKDLKANISTPYSLPANEITILMDGIELFQSAKFSFVDGFEIKKSTWGANFFVPVTYINSEGQSSGIDFSSSQIQTPPSAFPDKVASDNWIVHEQEGAVKTIPVKLEGKVIFKCTQNDPPLGFRMRFLTSNMTIATQNDFPIFGPMGPVVGQTYTFVFSVTVPMIPGEKILVEGIFTGGVTGAIDIGIEFQEGSDFTATFSNTFAASFIKGNTARTTFNRLAEKISPGAVTQSALLNDFNGLVVTSFDAVRGLDGAQVKTNLTDFFKSYNSILNAGMGVINNVLTMEKKEYYFNEADPIPLGLVKINNDYTFNDIRVNTLTIGYSPEDTNSVTDINGKQEFNTTAKYSSPVKKKVANLELISAYRADPFGIENARLNLDGKKTTSDNADNDVCIIDVDLDHPFVDPVVGIYYKLRRETYDVITGLLSPATVFNIRISPKRNMERHRSWLNSIFYSYEGKYLTFDQLDKNEDLFTQKGAVIYKENSDFLIGSSPRILKPHVFDITPEVSIDIVDLLETNPNRCFSFIHPINGLTYKGFNDKIGIAPNTLKEQAFLLISTPSNDLTTLET